MTRTGAAARPPLEPHDPDSVAEWLQANARWIGIAALVVAAALGGYWLFDNARDAKVARSQEALMRAGQSLGSGNIPLATTDLQRVVTQYDGTPAAIEAALLLAQLHYERREFQQGIDVLTRVADDDAPSTVAAPVQALIGDGYLELQRHTEAAQRYEQAAELTPFETERANNLASAARAYAMGDKKEEAIRIWTQLAEDPASPLMGEARIRLGELQAATARNGAS